MKKTILALTLALAFAGANAQSKQTTASGNAVASASKLETNPFTGRQQSVEQLQRQLEDAKLQTQLIEEALKQTNLRGEIGNVPLRKEVEAAQARTATRKEEIGQRDMEELQKAAFAARAADAQARTAKAARDAKEARDATVSAKRSAPRSKAQASPDESDEPDQPRRTVQPAPVARAIKPVLTSVIDFAGARSAVLDFGGNVLVAHDGDMTPLGPLMIVDGQSVNLNGQVYQVHSATMGRFVVSDKSTPEPGAEKGLVAAQPSSANRQTDSASLAPGAPPQRMALPPLQLPPGINILPASSK